MKTRYFLLITGLLLLALRAPARAQYEEGCQVPKVNNVNAGTDITVNSTVGGVQVMAALSKGARCAALICNSGATNPMRCDDTADQTVSGTIGQLVNANTCLKLEFEAWGQWNCFSTAGTTANVLEIRRK